MTNTIIVTEEQEYYIKIMFRDYESTAHRVSNLYNMLEYKKIPLDIVTVARIASGENYVVKKSIEVGDIVYNHKLDSVFEVTLGHVRGTLPNTRLSAVKANPDTYTLVTKRANKEEMK